MKATTIAARFTSEGNLQLNGCLCLNCARGKYVGKPNTINRYDSINTLPCSNCGHTRKKTIDIAKYLKRIRVLTKLQFD